MQQSVKVKICGLTREVDVALALSADTDYCGFIVYTQSPRGIPLKLAADLASLVPVGKRVLVDVNSEPTILSQAKDLGFDYFQIHCDLQIASSKLAEWSNIVGADRLWLAPRIGPDDDFPVHMLPYAQTILIDTYSKQQVGGTGQIGDWDRFAKLRQQYGDHHFILAGGLSPENVTEAITATGAEHIDVNSGIELGPGKKDPGKLQALFNVLQRA